MPAVHDEPPLSQHCQAAVPVDSARSGYGSLNRSKMTASLPLKAVATEDQNGTDSAESGIGFWQVAPAADHADAGTSPEPHRPAAAPRPATTCRRGTDPPQDCRT